MILGSSGDGVSWELRGQLPPTVEPAVWIEWGQGRQCGSSGGKAAVWIEWGQGWQCGSSGSRAGSVDRVGAGRAVWIE